MKTKRNKIVSWFLLLIFLGPWVAAHVIYALRNHFTFHSIATGKLLTPPIQAQSFPFFRSDWLGKWQIVYITPPQCDANCQTIMPILKQIYLALGKENYRVSYQTISAKTATALTKTNYIAPGDISIIDPRGWLIMQYPGDVDPQKLLKDMRRLLKYSHVG